MKASTLRQPWMARLLGLLLLLLLISLSAMAEMPPRTTPDPAGADGRGGLPGLSQSDRP